MFQVPRAPQAGCFERARTENQVPPEIKVNQKAAFQKHMKPLEDMALKLDLATAETAEECIREATGIVEAYKDTKTRWRKVLNAYTGK
eukprot:8333321-Alexandrium_andersonii.AAC.1